MKKTINNIKNCTGCGACLNICPVKAISMKRNKEGFLYPMIDENKCIKCGLCFNKCPAEHTILNNNSNPNCFALSANDDLRKDSSSGAVFPLLAEYILNKKGYVCGATWRDDNLVEHIIISDKKDLYKLKGSKYLQSDTKSVFSEIETLLNDGKLVLFSGTPCQVAGLNACLKKQYENLLTVDIVCHGVPSPMVYKKYISEIVSNETEKVLHTNFRDKINGWNPYLITTTTTINTYSTPAEKDFFMNAFLKNMCLRDSCSKCPFAQLPRQGDITLGDFWGIEKYSKKLNDKKGLSMVLINSKKGQEYIDLIKKECKIFEQVPLKYAIKGNPCLVRSSIPHADRNAFFERFDKMSLKDNVAITKGEKYDCGILNFWFCSNYGAMLTCYGLQETIKSFGLNPRVINYIPAKYLTNYKGSKSDDFSNKYLKLTELCQNKNDLTELNSQTDTFVVGSDQVWRHPYFWHNGANIFQLNFAKISKKKIACAVSFGVDYYEGNYLETQQTKFYVQQFDHISVREDDGVKVCKDTFDMPATHILDPVFLADKKCWNKILDNATCDKKDFIASYVLDQSNFSKQLLKKIKAHFKKFDNIDMTSGLDGCPYSVEDWLYAVKNCKFFVTDSFHGACFAIMFNKPFICIGNINRGYSRFKSLFKMFGLEKHCVLNLEDVSDNLDDYMHIEYDKVNELLQKEVTRSKEWLLNALNSPKKEQNEMYEFLKILDSRIDDCKRQISNVLNYSKLKKKKFKYKILSIIMFGKKQKKYKEKYKKMKSLTKEIKRSIKEFNSL